MTSGSKMIYHLWLATVFAISVLLQTTLALAQTDTTDLLNEEEVTFGDLVEEQPCWTGCDTLPASERDKCTEIQIMKYLSKNLEIGTMPLDLEIHRTIFVEYTIEKTGKVVDVVILRGMHPDIDDEVVKVVSAMPDFIPAKQRGKPVSVKYRLPVKIHWH